MSETWSRIWKVYASIRSKFWSNKQSDASKPLWNIVENIADVLDHPWGEVIYFDYFPVDEIIDCKKLKDEEYDASKKRR